MAIHSERICVLGWLESVSKRALVCSEMDDILPVCLPACLSICLSACLSICMSACPSTHLVVNIFVCYLLFTAEGKKWVGLDFHYDSGDKYVHVVDQNGSYSAVSSAVIYSLLIIILL